MTLRSTIYTALPVWAQNMAVSRIGTKGARWRIGDQFPEYLSQYVDRDKWEPQRINEYRRAKLLAYLELAYQESPYFRRLFDERGVNPSRDDPDEAVGSLPVLTKDVIREYRGQIENPAAAGDVQTVHTSGTTGRGLIFPWSRESAYATWATWWRYRLRFGLKLETPSGVFLGSVLTPVGQKKPPFWRRNKNQFENQWIYSNYHLGPETAKYYVEHLRSTRVSWIHGYPSTLALLASLISEQDLDPGDTVRIVTMASENVLESQVETICRAFGAEVRQHYGQAEGVANFSECEYGQIHVDEDYTTVEFLPMDDGASRVIGTGVNNSAFFLIRYDTGDRVHEGGDGCECGRSGRIVKSIDGRSEDYIVLPNGSMVGRLDHVFKDMVNVREAQLVQDVRERMKVMIVPLDNYGPDDEKQLLYEFRLRIGDAIELDIDYVERIPRTPSGKLRFVVSSLSSNELGIARDN